MTDQKIELIVPAIKWFSPGDEATFYRWLTSLDVYVGSEMRENVLHVTIDVSKVDKAAVEDLVAIFYRYNIDDWEQLSALDNPKITRWFKDSIQYWAYQIFRKRRRGDKRNLVDPKCETVNE